MLNIFSGDMPEAIYNTAVYFKNTYKKMDYFATNKEKVEKPILKVNRSKAED